MSDIDDLKHTQKISNITPDQIQEYLKITTGKIQAIATEVWANKIAELERKGEANDHQVKEHEGVLTFIRRKLGVKKTKGV